MEDKKRHSSIRELNEEGLLKIMAVRRERSRISGGVKGSSELAQVILSSYIKKSLEGTVTNLEISENNIRYMKEGMSVHSHRMPLLVVASLNHVLMQMAGIDPYENGDREGAISVEYRGSMYYFRVNASDKGAYPGKLALERMCE